MNPRRRIPAHTPRARAARAFSLVEVLIAVLVLALGLLGLGAVFPMVMREQRIATETTLGLSARNAAEQMLFSNAAFARDGGPGWGALREYVIDNQQNRGDWVAVVPERSDLAQLNAYLLPDASSPTAVIPLAQRLYPLPYSTGEQPRFVWDLAARLVDPGRPDTSPLRVALFLRPIDPGIRTSQGDNGARSLTATLVDPSIPGRDRRNPVSLDRDGRPTLDGTRQRGAQYATPVVAEAAIGPGVDPDVHNQLVLQNVLQPSMDDEVGGVLLVTPGQRFLDRDGRLYTVTQAGAIANTIRRATFAPEVEDFNGDGSVDGDDINPIMFLPQRSAVEPLIFTVNP